MNLDQLHNKIEAYLRNEMPAAERSQFEQDIKQNPEWKEELLLHTLSHEAIEQMVEDDARQKLDKIRAKAKKKTPEPVAAPEPDSTAVISIWQRPIVKWGMAATIIGLVVLAALYLPNNSRDASPTFVEDVKKLERDQVSSNQLGGGSTLSWQACLDHYDAEAYQAAITCFEAEDQSDVLIAQYLAHSYFKIDQPVEAANRFQQLLQQSEIQTDTDVYTRVEWNWLLTLALQKQDQQLIPLLDSVLSIQTYRYKLEAQKLRELISNR